jgi:hypothetical protein
MSATTIVVVNDRTTRAELVAQLVKRVAAAKGIRRRGPVGSAECERMHSHIDDLLFDLL